MLTAMVAVDNIAAGVTSKANIWAINTEQEYHDEKKETVVQRPEKESVFTDFLWKNKWNRTFVLFAGSALLMQFFIFKFLYPFANYMPDSYSYLDAAYLNVDVNMWPVAYSKFLRIFSSFTHSDTLLVGFQYFFMQMSGLCFLSSVLYLFKPGKIISAIFYIFFLFNPLALYLSNYISADAIFIGLSFLWITQLLWIICRPRPWQLFSQAFLLMLVFTVRYNAIYYPVIAALAILLSKQRSWIKGAGIALGSGFVLFSILYTSNKMGAETGHNQFSAFGGWQLANNALYAYQQVKPDKSNLVPVQFIKLEAMVQQHKDTLSRIKFSREDSIEAHFYLWSDRGPLIQYMVREWKNDSTTPYFKRWAAEAPLYGEYGLWLIKKYPLEFAKGFLLPNAMRYALPPLEFLGIYNMGRDSVGLTAKEWFRYKSQRVKNYYKDHKTKILGWYPVFSSLANLSFVIGLIGFLVFNGIKKADAGFSKALLLILSLWLVNMGFSVFASPITLRYQVFPVTMCFVFSLLSIRFVDMKE